MLRRSIVAAVVACAAGLLSAVPAAAQVRPFDPPQTVVGVCAAEYADAVVTNTGALAGFASCPRSSGVSIRFFSRNPDGSVNPSENSGFTGRVMAVTYDATATYVLYFNDFQILIGKRTNAGAFSTRAVDTWPAALFPTGDIIARDGRWFGVWSRQTGPGGEFAQTELFFGGTTLARRQLSTTAGNIDDDSPTLAYSGSLPVLVWSRFTSAEMPGPSNLMVRKFISGTWEPERLFASLGTNNGSPDIYIRAGVTFITWVRDGFIMFASNAEGPFGTHRFNTGGFGPKVAASATSGVVDHVFVTWTAPRAGGDQVFFAESASAASFGPWNGAFIAPAGTRAFSVGAFATRATVVYGTGANVAARSQA